MIKHITHTFRALRVKNYRLFFIGQSLSLIGSWMQQIAASWLIYRMTGSAFLLGAVGFAAQIPSFVLGPFAGVIADRHTKRKILIATQCTAMVQASLLTILAFTNLLQVWHIVVLSALLGFVNAFDIPTRHAFLIEMVNTKDELANAIALNSSMFNSARLVGPAVAGVIIGAFGERTCFLINAVSYLAVIMALLQIRVAPREKSSHRNHIMTDFKEGFRYVMGFRQIRYILFLLAILSLTGVPYQVLMPVFARDIFAGGPHMLGFLVGVSGAGAFIGSLYLASRKNTDGFMRLITAGALTVGTAISLFAVSRILILSLIFSFTAGFAMMVSMAAINTTLQTMVDDSKRGRVMSFYTTSFMGMMPFGSILAGTFASLIGAPMTVFYGGLCSITATLFFARKIRKS